MQTKQSKIDPDGLRALVLGMVELAGRDARGHGQTAAEARAWLLSEAPELLELLGFSCEQSMILASIEALPQLKPGPKWQGLYIAVIREAVKPWTV